MDLHVTLSGAAPLSLELYGQLRAAILDGRLRSGDAVPPSRALADQLGVSRNTVSHAYHRLIAEGFLNARVGSGTFVSAEASLTEARRAPAGSGLAPRPLWSSLLQTQERAPPATYDFRIGTPDSRLFPWETWRRLMARELRPRAKRGRALELGDPAGHPALRAAVARHLGLSRSVQAGPDDVIITSGAQQALDLIARVLVEPGSTVAVEDPGYPAARRVFASHGAHLAPTPVDGEGLDAGALPAAARLVYVTPSHQFPLGMPMTLARRTALLGWADRQNAMIIEDDYDSEFRFRDRPLEPIQSLDRRGRVLYVGSFSKVLLPQLRLGFLVAPSALLPALRAAKELSGGHSPETTQAALAHFIDEGGFARHLRRLNRIYRKRRDRLLDALERHLSRELEVVPAMAGLHVAAKLKRRVEVGPLLQRARERDVAVEALSPFQGKKRSAGLVIGFGMIPAEKIEQGIARLAACWA